MFSTVTQDYQNYRRYSCNIVTKRVELDKLMIREAADARDGRGWRGRVIYKTQRAGLRKGENTVLKCVK